MPGTNNQYSCIRHKNVLEENLLEAQQLPRAQLESKLRDMSSFKCFCGKECNPWKNYEDKIMDSMTQEPGCHGK